MPGRLHNSAADVLSRVLVALGIGTDPSAGASWPVYVGSEPTSPDDCLTVFNGEGKDNGRVMAGGERQGMEGIQVRVRSAKQDEGEDKADEIKVALDESIYDEAVVIDGRTYNVHSFSRVGGVIPLGKERTSSRSLFTINGFVSVRERP